MRSGSRSTTAFVLAGGGSLGAVEVGMLEALEEERILPNLAVLSLNRWTQRVRNGWRSLVAIAALLSIGCVTEVRNSMPAGDEPPERSGIQLELAGVGFDFGAHSTPGVDGDLASRGYALEIRRKVKPPIGVTRSPSHLTKLEGWGSRWHPDTRNRLTSAHLLACQGSPSLVAQGAAVSAADQPDLRLTQGLDETRALPSGLGPEWPAAPRRLAGAGPDQGLNVNAGLSSLLCAEPEVPPQSSGSEG